MAPLAPPGVHALDFYFDFASPYAYIASQLIDDVAARYGRTVNWHPILLGVIFKETGARPLTDVPLKREYAKRDFERSARFHGIADYRTPVRFPIPAQAPSLIVLAIRQHDPVRAASVTKALYRAYFSEGKDISDPDVAAGVAGRNEDETSALRAAVDDPGIKDALKSETAQAMAAGVFGAPFVIADAEPFWGLDRFPQLERWLDTNGS